MRTPEILDRLTIRMPEEIFLVVKDFAKKKQIPYAVAARELIRRGIGTFDREFRNTENKLDDIWNILIEMHQSLAALSDTAEETNEAVLRDTDESAALRFPLLEIVAELWLVGRLEFKKKYPIEYAKRAEVVSAQVAAIREYAFRKSGSKAGGS